MLAFARRDVAALALLLAGCARKETLAFDAPVRVNERSKWAQAEPAIAARGSLVVVSWIDWTPPRPLVRVAASTNGGVSFGASIPVETPAREHEDGQADPTLAIGDDGVVHLAWLACGRDEAGLGGRRCDVRTRTSADARTWSEPKAITDSPLYRERPWLVVDRGTVTATWSEAGANGTWTFKHGKQSAPDFSSVLKPDRLGLLVDRTKREPLEIHLLVWPTGERFVVDRPAVLLDYSYGAIAGNWIALATGDGNDCDFRLLRKFREKGRARTPGATRVGLPWMEPAGKRVVFAWIEERADGWHVMARLLGSRIGPATEVTRAPFRFATASLEVNIGDYLQATAAGDDVWIAWSDTHTGDADVYVARARLPRP